MSEADGRQVDDSLAYAPATTSLGTSPTEGFSASFDAGRRNAAEYAQFGNMSSALQDHLDAVKRKTGQQFDNPLANYTIDPKAAERTENTAQALYELSQKHNDPSLAMPDGDTLYEQGAMKARASQRAEDEAMAAPISTLGKAAALLGGFAGRSTDPLFLANNTIAMLGFGAGGPLAAAALKSAISMGTAQLGTALGSMDFKRAVNPEYGYGDIAKETAEAAGMAAGAEVGGRGIAALWRQLRGRAPSVAAMTPQPIADAANVAERASDLEANNPFKTGLTGAQAHHDAVTQLEIPLARGEPLPPAPASVVAEAKVPTGQVFAGGRAVDVKYELAEVRDLITSHDQNFMINPAFPAELQPRERGNVASRAQVYDMAANLEPARLGPSPEANAGAPLVGPDNVVESGNGRVMAIRSAYDQGLDQSGAYRAFLERSGFDTSQTRQPVLVARRTAPYAAPIPYPAMFGDMPETHILDAKRNASSMSDLVVAAKTTGGVIKYGEPGQIHADLYDPSWDIPAEGSALKELGFARPGGPFMPRQEAFDFVERQQRAAFAHAANSSASLRLGTTEQAMSDARHIDSGLIDRMESGALDSAGNRDFRQAFAGKLIPGEAGGMLTKSGELSATGLQRVKAAVVARAYGDAGLVSRAFEHPDSNIKTIANALTDAAPDWIKMRDAFTRGTVPATQDVTADLMASIKAIMRARDEGKPVWEILNQGDIFHSDTAGLAARLFFKDGSFRRFLSRGDMADNLSTVARDVASSAERGPDMFGAPPITPKEAIAGRVSQREIAPESDLLTKAHDDPAVHDAMVADLQRNIDQGNNKVPITDENGNSALGVADKELHNAERQEMLAKEIGQCAGGPAVGEAAE